MVSFTKFLASNMKRFFKFFKGYVAETILSPLFKLLEACSELCVPLIVAKIIDVGIVNGDKPYILKLCVLLAFLGVAGLAIALTGQYFASKSASGYAYGVRRELMQKVNALSFSQLDKAGTSKIVNTMTEDVTMVQTGINLTLRLFLRSPFIVIGAVIFAFAIDSKASIIFAVLLPLLCLVVFLIMSRGVGKFKLARESADKLLLSTRENLYGVREVRAFGLQRAQTENFERFNEQLRQKNNSASNFISFLNPLTYALVNLAIIVLIYSGAIRVNVGKLTQGQVVALYNYMSQILVELVKFATLTINLSKTIASWDRVSRLLDVEIREQPNIIEGKRQNLPYISIKNLNFAYTQGSKLVLENVNLTLEKGQTLGIIGGTGSGKTTLVSLLFRGYLPTEGELYLDGKSITDYTDAEIRNRVALVPQKAVLFNDSLRGNMQWGNLEATDEQITKAILDASGEEILEKCGGLDAQVSEGGKNFSGGQRQRLTIARALLKKADLIIFDDSFSALDFATEAKLKRNLEGYSATKIIISQRVSTIKNADKIIVMDKGKIDSEGTLEELLEKSQIFKEIYFSQVKEQL